jgi:hypothetical protein
MNIFVLDANPITAARFHNDRHVVKMILESCQLMATAHYSLDGSFDWRDNVQLRPTHVNHPCAVWVRSGHYAYGWVHALCGALLTEYRNRYNKVHAYSQHWEHLWLRPANLPLDSRLFGNSPHPLCMPETCKVRRGRAPNAQWDTVLSYRNYYVQEKQHLAQWYNGMQGMTPPWFKERT